MLGSFWAIPSKGKYPFKYTQVNYEDFTYIMKFNIEIFQNLEKDNSFFN